MCTKWPCWRISHIILQNSSIIQELGQCNWVTVICEQGECSDKHVGKGLSAKSRIIGMWGCNKEKTAEYTLIGHIITYTCSTACWYQIASRSIKVHFNRQTQSRWPAEEKLNIGMWKNSDLSDFKHRTQLLVPDWLVQVFQKPLILKYPVSSSSVGKNVNVMVQKRMAKLQNRRLMMTLMSLDFRIWHKYHGSIKPSFQIQLLLVV